MWPAAGRSLRGCVGVGTWVSVLVGGGAGGHGFHRGARGSSVRTAGLVRASNFRHDMVT